MNKNGLGTKLVERLLAHGLTEDDLALLAESDCATDRAAIALTEVVAILYVMALSRSRSEETLTVDAVVAAINEVAAFSGDAWLQYAAARDQCSKFVYRKFRPKSGNVLMGSAMGSKEA